MRPVVSTGGSACESGRPHQLTDALADVHAVIIASATDTHFPYIMESLRADKAVLSEKPISHELHEVGASDILRFQLFLKPFESDPLPQPDVIADKGQDHPTTVK